MFQVQYFDRTNSDSSRYVTLDYVPTTPDQVALDIVGGTAQYYSANGDFIVSGDQVSWDFTNSPLYTMLGVPPSPLSPTGSDRLRVMYDRT